MKLQVDITADNRDDALTAIREVYDQVRAGNTKGTINGPDGVGVTGLFELLDSQPAAEQTA